MFLRKTSIGMLVAAVLGAVFALGFLLGNKTAPASLFESSTTGRAPEPETSNSEHGTLNLEHETLVVSRVIDGDTVEFSSGERVRLIGVDAPERGACFFEQSKQTLEKLALQKTVRSENEISDRDRYGRLLRHLYVGDVFINLALVEQGAATAYPYPPDTAHTAEFSEAQARAKEQNRGLWSACASSLNLELSNLEPLNVEPLNMELVPGGCTIKGNISSSGEKIYHLPGCGSYEKTRIDEQSGEQWFCSEAEAQAAGWRKAGNCH